MDQVLASFENDNNTQFMFERYLMCSLQPWRKYSLILGKRRKYGKRNVQYSNYRAFWHVNWIEYVNVYLNKKATTKMFDKLTMHEKYVFEYSTYFSLSLSPPSNEENWQSNIIMIEMIAHNIQIPFSTNKYNVVRSTPFFWFKRVKSVQPIKLQLQTLNSNKCLHSKAIFFSNW